MGKLKKNTIFVLVAIIAIAAIIIWSAKSRNDEENGYDENNPLPETTQIDEPIQADDEGENRGSSNEGGLSQPNGGTSFVKEDGSIMDHDEKVEQLVKSGLDEETAKKMLDILENPSDIE